jgi:hypothetical protein
VCSSARSRDSSLKCCRPRKSAHDPGVVRLQVEAPVPGLVPREDRLDGDDRASHRARGAMRRSRSRRRREHPGRGRRARTPGGTGRADPSPASSRSSLVEGRRAKAVRGRDRPAFPLEETPPPSALGATERSRTSSSDRGHVGGAAGPPPCTRKHATGGSPVPRRSTTTRPAGASGPRRASARRASGPSPGRIAVRTGPSCAARPAATATAASPSSSRTRRSEAAALLVPAVEDRRELPGAVPIRARRASSISRTFLDPREHAPPARNVMRVPPAVGLRPDQLDDLDLAEPGDVGPTARVQVEPFDLDEAHGAVCPSGRPRERTGSAPSSSGSTQRDVTRRSSRSVSVDLRARSVSRPRAGCGAFHLDRGRRGTEVGTRSSRARDGRAAPR